MNFYLEGIYTAIEKFAADPTVTEALVAAINRLGTAGLAAGHSGAQAFKNRYQQLGSSPLSRFSKTTAGITDAIGHGAATFYNKGGVGALLPLGGAALAGYGAKKLYDKYTSKNPHEMAIDYNHGLF